jgi:hypothetical protein
MRRLFLFFVAVSVALALVSGCVASGGSSSSSIPNIVGRWESTSTFPIDINYDGTPDTYGKYVMIVENQNGSTFTGLSGGVELSSGIQAFLPMTGTITSGGNIVITETLTDPTTGQTVTKTSQGVYASGRITIIGENQTIDLVKVQ